MKDFEGTWGDRGAEGDGGGRGDNKPVNFNKKAEKKCKHFCLIMHQ